ncbi:hypothetical protein B5723_11245 [Mammaliicoccus sciuri]|uniref:HNH endonuclease signature motif containing protein n=1 Tax=Mammaliicoccus sciuri TaxID=1296 RepID=UPI0009FD4DE5|nr:HNH endonuclease signature motif containing protein [Mammaliicoccus sciuri]ORI01734.1 hypothetical protein B5723_11245 [Mammaliicoccus sciuri]
MTRKSISRVVERKLYAESMGLCMNPNCKEEVIKFDSDISEKAHIVPYCETKDNNYENLLILCPNCHTKFDKDNAFSIEEVKSWKSKRLKDREKLLEKTYSNFDDLERDIKPLLKENLIIYSRYYLSGNKKGWDRSENKIIANNTKIKNLLIKNEHLLNDYQKTNSNMDIVTEFILHTEEFESSRMDEEKIRSIFYPKELNSIFGVDPILESKPFPSVESLESLINIYLNNGTLEKVDLGAEEPNIRLKKADTEEIIFLNDERRLHQLYHVYDCFRDTKVRLDSLIFVLKYLRTHYIEFEFRKLPNVRGININSHYIVFVYEYCLTKEFLLSNPYPQNTIIVNLHGWNEGFNISSEAKDVALDLNITLLTSGEFFRYVHSIK